ncbi:MAG TPA: MFS transporter [Candidatus Paceibacterota bacterium]
MNKKQLFLWSLYDFANSIVYINFVLYFAQWLVVDAGLSDFWYNAIFAVTTIMMLFTAPHLAAETDLRGGRKRWLNITTVATFVLYALTVILALKSANIWLIALVFLLGQYFYQLSFVFFNPMLDDIADTEHKSRASGIGNFASSLGFVFGILITFPFADSRLTPLLISIPVFLILALPMLMFFKDSEKQSLGNKILGPSLGSLVLIKKMIAFFAVSAAAPMLIAFFFFNDALLTVSNNYSIYLERVFHAPDTAKSILLMAILVMSAAGSWLAGWLGDKIGSLKTLKWILVAWIIILPTLALAPNFLTMAILSPIIGLFIGSVVVVTRAYLTTVLPKENMNYGFSFYTMAERFSSIVGPLTWGAIVWSMGSSPISYRIAAGSMAAFVLLGLIILSRWKRSVA